MQPSAETQPEMVMAAFSPVRPATTLLRELIELSDLFEKSLADELGVNATDMEVMEHLLMSGPLGPTDLARRVGLSAGAITTAIDRLVTLGHVSREPHPTDRRGVLVAPNPRSRERAMGRLLPMIMGIDAELDAFTAAEQDVITSYLRRATDSLRTAAGGAEVPESLPPESAV
ncbi:MarR family transcriptional regulator [uncultured Microbacterium sp.]|uniref:MarR family winged helix-turn-helix transcriptional regulator n=1 Tax=uncultured Microbacterium sp. TaxID=191216 RepID=UPI0028D906B0|nr:MarR family transcriptional regulator [uncultured Microbacterium sp.]